MRLRRHAVLCLAALVGGIVVAIPDTPIDVDAEHVSSGGALPRVRGTIDVAELGLLAVAIGACEMPAGIDIASAGDQAPPLALAAASDADRNAAPDDGAIDAATIAALVAAAAETGVVITAPEIATLPPTDGDGGGGIGGAGGPPAFAPPSLPGIGANGPTGIAGLVASGFDAGGGIPAPGNPGTVNGAGGGGGGGSFAPQYFFPSSLAANQEPGAPLDLIDDGFGEILAAGNDDPGISVSAPASLALFAVSVASLTAWRGRRRFIEA
jgi:hypothetical protein